MANISEYMSWSQRNGSKGRLIEEFVYSYIMNHQITDKNKYDLIWVALSFLVVQIDILDYKISQWTSFKCLLSIQRLNIYIYIYMLRYKEWYAVTFSELRKSTTTMELHRKRESYLSWKFRPLKIFRYVSNVYIFNLFRMYILLKKL